MMWPDLINTLIKYGPSVVSSLCAATQDKKLVYTKCDYCGNDVYFENIRSEDLFTTDFNPVTKTFSCESKVCKTLHKIRNLGESNEQYF